MTMPCRYPGPPRLFPGLVFRCRPFWETPRTEGLLLYTKVGRPPGLSGHEPPDGPEQSLPSQPWEAPESVGGPSGAALFQSSIWAWVPNDLGWRSPEGFLPPVCPADRSIRQLQPPGPDLSSDPAPVTSRKSNEGIFTNAKITAYNQKLRLLRPSRRSSSAGYLVPVCRCIRYAAPPRRAATGSISSPTLHEKWLSYLQTHTVAFDSGKEGAP